MSDLNPYQTSDTPFAAFLRYHAHEIISTQQDKADRRRTIFIFVEQPNTQELEDLYYNNKAEIEPRVYYKCLKEVFRRLNGR
jgi:hypothetical protein